MNLGCTQKLLKELGKKPATSSENKSWINNWHAYLIIVDRRKCFLLTNNETLFSVFIPGLKKNEFKVIEEVIRQALFKCLINEGLDQASIEQVLDNMKEIIFCKSSSRSVLGSMNDLVNQIDCRVYMSNGLLNTDIVELNRELNRIPLGVIDYSYANEKFKELINT